MPCRHRRSKTLKERLRAHCEPLDIAICMLLQTLPRILGVLKLTLAFFIFIRQRLQAFKRRIVTLDSEQLVGLLLRLVVRGALVFGVLHIANDASLHSLQAVVILVVLKIHNPPGPPANAFALHSQAL